MVKTEELLELYTGWLEVYTTAEEVEVMNKYTDRDDDLENLALGYVGGYRTAETKWMEAMRDVIKELKESRDDVASCVYRPEQLARIDAMIAKYNGVELCE